MTLFLFPLDMQHLSTSVLRGAQWFSFFVSLQLCSPLSALSSFIWTLTGSCCIICSLCNYNWTVHVTIHISKCEQWVRSYPSSEVLKYYIVMMAITRRFHYLKLNFVFLDFLLLFLVRVQEKYLYVFKFSMQSGVLLGFKTFVVKHVMTL